MERMRSELQRATRQARRGKNYVLLVRDVRCTTTIYTVWDGVDGA